MNHLFLRIGRLPDAKNPKKDMHASFDALMTVFKGHLVAAACTELGISGPDSDIPLTCPESPQGVQVSDIASKVVDRFTIVSEAVLGLPLFDCNDRVHNYSRVLCHAASLTMEFTDAWSEGDGPRVLRCWKVFLLHFFAARKTKYALEALRIQTQLATLSPDLVHQLTWGRFVNSHGSKGHNIPCDLHNEHINKLFKDVIRNMGANFTEIASTRVARALTTIAHLVEAFDSNTGINPGTTAHSRKSDEGDVRKIVAALLEQEILTVQPLPRYHSSFKTMTPNPLKSLDRPKLEKWIKSKLHQFSNRLAVVRDSNADSDTDEINDPHFEAESEEEGNDYSDFGILESELDEEFDY